MTAPHPFITAGWPPKGVHLHPRQGAIHMRPYRIREDSGIRWWHHVIVWASVLACGIVW